MHFSKLSGVERILLVWALAIASTALLVVLVALGSAVSENSSNVASWVQAVGSIAAIAAGFRLAHTQRQEAISAANGERRAAESRATQIFVSRIVLAHGACKRLREQLDSEQPSWIVVNNTYAEVKLALLDIPIDEVPSPAAATITRALSGPIRGFGRKLETCEQAKANLTPELLRIVRNDLQRLTVLISRAQTVTKRQLDRLLTKEERAEMVEALQAMRD